MTKGRALIISVLPFRDGRDERRTGDPTVFVVMDVLTLVLVTGLTVLADATIDAAEHGSD
jgi:hypothetical protein